jgi:hypothetical protein
MARRARVPFVVMMSVLLTAIASGASPEQGGSIYLDVLPSWGKAAETPAPECGQKVHGELLEVFAKSHLSVIDPGRGNVAVPLEARVAGVWTSQKSGTTTYIGLLVERGKATSAHVYYPAPSETPPKRATAQSEEDLRAVTRRLAAAEKAQESARLARMVTARLASLPASFKAQTTPMTGDFLLDGTPGPAVVLKLALETDATGCAALPGGVATAITDAVREFLRTPKP